MFSGAAAGTSLAVASQQHSTAQERTHGYQVEGSPVPSRWFSNPDAGHRHAVTRARRPSATESHTVTRGVGTPHHPGPAADRDDRSGDLRGGDPRAVDAGAAGA